MRWIEFTETVQFESERRGKGPVFARGERHHLEDAFAERWLRRGVAKLVDGPAVPKPKAKDDPASVEPKPAAPPSTSEAKLVERVKPRNG